MSNVTYLKIDKVFICGCNHAKFFLHENGEVQCCNCEYYMATLRVTYTPPVEGGAE